MTAESKYVIALAVLCVLLLIGGALLARVLSRATPRILRIAWPLTAAATGGVFAVFVFIARSNAH